MSREDELDFSRLSKGFQEIEILFSWYSKNIFDSLMFEGLYKKVRCFHCLRYVLSFRRVEISEQVYRAVGKLLHGSSDHRNVSSMDIKDDCAKAEYADCLKTPIKMRPLGSIPISVKIEIVLRAKRTSPTKRSIVNVISTRVRVRLLR